MNLLYISIIFYINGSIQDVTFWIWIFSSAEFPRVSSKLLDLSILFHSLIILYCLYHTCLFNHSSVVGHLGSFKFWTITSKGALNICVNINFHFFGSISVSNLWSFSAFHLHLGFLSYFLSCSHSNKCVGAVSL